MMEVIQRLGFGFAPFEQRQMVVSVADDLGFLGRGITDLVTEPCVAQDTA